MSSFFCSSCKNTKYFEVMNFGKVALAGAFIKRNQVNREKKYKMTLVFCNSCKLLQIKEKIKPKVLFENYFYFSSFIKTLSKHFKQYSKYLIKLSQKNNLKSILEIGCNDGILLRNFINQKFNLIIGVDPARNVLKSIKKKEIIKFPDFFSYKNSKIIKKKYGAIDIITASNVFAHINDIRDAVKGVENLLSDEGLFIFEVHYLGNLLKKYQFDMIYHEHIYYYSINSAINLLKQFNLRVIDYNMINIHAGSIRIVSTKCNNKYKVKKKVIDLSLKEKKQGFNSINFYKNYSNAIDNKMIKLITLINNLKKNNKKIFAYGASGRANTILQYCNFTNDQIDMIIDDSPKKNNFITPGSHIKITNKRSLISKEKPDYILILAWSFFNEIVKKNLKYFSYPCKVILPLPNLKVLNIGDYLK